MYPIVSLVHVGASAVLAVSGVVTVWNCQAVALPNIHPVWCCCSAHDWSWCVPSRCPPNPRRLSPTCKHNTFLTVNLLQQHRSVDNCNHLLFTHNSNYHTFDGPLSTTTPVSQYQNKLAHTGLMVDSYLLPTSKSRDTKTGIKIQNPAQISSRYCPLI